MKKFIALLTVLCLLLSGCSAGDTKSTLITKLQSDKKEAYFYGTWRSIVDNSVLIFAQGKQCTADLPSAQGDGTFSAEDSAVITPWDHLSLETFRGVECLCAYSLHNSQWEPLVFVREEDYSRVAPQEIVLTMDNWDTYFEIRDLNLVTTNSDEETVVLFVQGVYLKDEYKERLKNIPGAPLDIFFTVKRDVVHCDVEDPLGENPVFSNWQTPVYGLETTTQVHDNREVYVWHPKDGRNGAVVAEINSGYAYYFHTVYMESNSQVTGVEGSLWLYPPLEES